MKFVADVMLGRLARLMRFAGYDVEYSSTADDDSLVRRSRYRILLTRDRELSRRVKEDRVYFVNSVGAEKQLQEIRERFAPESASPRCLVCNHRIRRIRKDSIEHLVPPFIFRKQEDFFRCGGCGRIYWQGTHFDRMTRMIK